jgi:hypothetical protein
MLRLRYLSVAFVYAAVVAVDVFMAEYPIVRPHGLQFSGML